MNRSATESKNAPRWRRGARRLGHGPVEEVGQGGEDQQGQPGAQGAGADRDRRSDGDDHAEEGDVVGGDAGALELLADRLQLALRFGSEVAIEHGGVAPGDQDCLQKLAEGARESDAFDTRGPER